MNQGSFHLPNSLTKLGSLGSTASVPPTLLPFFFGATSASSDGGVIAGHSLTARDGIHAFRWSQATGMADLGTFGSLGVNNRSNATGMSRDGAVIVGDDKISESSSFAFRWTNAANMVHLAPTNCIVRAVNGDGSVVAGLITTPTGHHVFRWSAATNMVDLGTLGGPESLVGGLSRDGSVLVGRSDLSSSFTPPPRRAFRWTSTTGMVDLGTLGGQDSNATATNNDGSVVVGDSNTVQTINTHAFRWTPATGMADLGTLGGDISSAKGVSSDGSVVVGTGSVVIGGALHLHAFRWTSATGMVDLGSFGDDNQVMEITGMSGDGSVIVGHAKPTTSAIVKRAYRWTSVTGMQDLNDLLSRAGVDMTGISLQVSGVSENGKVMFGLGNFPDAMGMPYIAQIDA
jgi:probable HAF family extracellular repeat protein